MMHDTFGHLFLRLGVNEKKDVTAVVHGRQGPVAGRQISLFGRQFSILEGVLPIDRARVSTDIVAGVTLAALAIPEVMGYTKIAGMPVITGLYTILIPIALFALLGSSRHLVVGADPATAAIMAAGLAGLAATASPQYVALAGLLALRRCRGNRRCGLVGRGDDTPVFWPAQGARRSSRLRRGRRQCARRTGHLWGDEAGGGGRLLQFSRGGPGRFEQKQQPATDTAT